MTKIIKLKKKTVSDVLVSDQGGSPEQRVERIARKLRGRTVSAVSIERADLIIEFDQVSKLVINLAECTIGLWAGRIQ